MEQFSPKKLTHHKAVRTQEFLIQKPRFPGIRPLPAVIAALLLTIAGSSAGYAQNTGSGSNGSTGQVDCSDPAVASTSLCRPPDQVQQGGEPAGAAPTVTTGLDQGLPQRSNGSETQPYVDTAGTNPNRTNPTSANRANEYFPPDPVTDFQRLARTSTGEFLPIFGRDLFQRAPSTFAPADQIPVTSDYVIGPGDQLLVRLWGPLSFNSQLTVDPTGAIYIPRVGSIQVSGLRFDQLQRQLDGAISRIYRNYQLSVTVGRLRSIQVYVVGEARRPGAYTISALSTVLNALFVSGGPTVQGSLRNIQIRRTGQPPVMFDLYDLLLRGDKSKDVKLDQGDTIFIPPAGPEVALAGSVRHPAIYELAGPASVADVLEYAGGYTPTASDDRLRLERIDTDRQRKALSISIASEAKTTTLRDGDVLFVNHISQAYQQSVTIRGNLANPGRFPWHAGMRLSEIIPERTSLLTRDYWQQRNRLGIPVPLFEPLPQYGRYGAAGQNGTGTGIYLDDQNGTNAQIGRSSAAALALQNTQLPPTANSTATPSILQNGVQNQTGTPGTLPATPGVINPSSQQGSTYPGQGYLGTNSSDPRQYQNRIEIPAAEIDWSYAVIERLSPDTLKSSLLPFNLGRLVQDHDATQDLELQPGDIVTILSQADIPVSQAQQTKYVRLEGEFVSSGVYSVHPGETLDQLVSRAGGLTPNAYLYGSSFLRESARVFQQQRLDEYISTLNADMERASAVRAANNGVLDPNALAQQQNLIAQLRQMRASGRVVLEFVPENTTADTIPKLSMENGDVFRVPSRPSTVSVIGAVYGQNVFLYQPKRRLEDYISLAGKPNRIADPSHAFIIRADGSVFSRERAKGVLSNHFDSARINPGDAIVIPEKLIKPSAIRQFADYTSILSSFGLTAAAVSSFTR